MLLKSGVPGRIVIVGGGTAGWMAANLLAHHWGPRGCQISLIESSVIGTVGVGEGSTPKMRTFFETLGIPESEWMPACNATYKCGISFPRWSVDEGFETYFHPFFSQLDIEPAEAFYTNCKLRRSGYEAPVSPNDYFVSSVLARKHKAPITTQPRDFDHDYGYHFDATLLGQFLHRRAVAEGVEHLIDTVTRIEQSDDGDITALVTESHGELEADFFVDCSGFASLLIGKTLAEPFVEYPNLLNDRAVAIPSPVLNKKQIPSETVSTALKFGWAWRIPLVNRFGNGYVYSSAFCTPEEAERELRDHLGPAVENAEARHLRMRVGRVGRHWRNNCLAVGLSQGFIEPLEATALNLVQVTIETFIDDFEEHQGSAESREIFNHTINQAFEDVRNYIVLHYKLNTRRDTEYWRANREETEVSDVLEAVLEAWDADSGFDEEWKRSVGGSTYQLPSWYCILAGMGRFPGADRAPPREMLADVKRARGKCIAMANRFHDHARLLRSYA